MSVNRGKKSIAILKNDSLMKLAAGAVALVAGLSPALAEAHGHHNRGPAQVQNHGEPVEADEAQARPHEIIIEAADCDCDAGEAAPVQAVPEEEEAPEYAAPAPEPYPAPAPEPYAAPAPQPTREAPRYTVYPRQAAAPAVVVAPASKFGLGVMVSTVDVNHGELQAQGIGLLGRLRISRGLQLELQVSRDEFEYDPRVDERVGADAIYSLGKPGGFTPYVVLGAGFNSSARNPDADKNGEDSISQTYLEAGIGLDWELLPRITLAADVRLQARRFERVVADDRSAKDSSADDSDEHGRTTTSGKEETLEGRLSVVYSF